MPAPATGRRRRKQSRPRSERFVAFQYWEVECNAFSHLSADATRLYLFMRIRVNFDGGNNGRVPFSHRDAASALRSGWRRASNALDELQHFGFIKSRTQAARGPGALPATEWQFAAFPCGGQPASKAFLAWDGTVFEPRHRSKLGRKTMNHRNEISHGGQNGVGNMKTPRRQHEDASGPGVEIPTPKTPKSVGNMKTLSHHRRRQHDGTTTYTRQGAAKPGAAAGVGGGTSEPPAGGVAGGGGPGTGSGVESDTASKNCAAAENDPEPGESEVARHDALVRRLRRWSNGGVAPDRIGERMRRWREAKGWSQADLALKSGLRVSKLCKLERGQQNVSRADYAALIEALAVDPLQVRPMLEWQHND